MKIDMPKIYNREESEEKWKKYWEQEKIYTFQYDPQKPLYIVDTPPPYVSADHLHAGHIMSYAQAEFVVRFKRMRGFSVFYPMGFDDNGLPTERFVEKKYNINKSKTTRSDFIKLCLKETEIGSRTYKTLWNNLGISVDWSKTYSTISPIAVKVSQWSLIDLWKKGALYRSEDPILWCPHCQTAIAQADLEDMTEDSKLNYIHFLFEDGTKGMIATTRPELIPACVSLYVNAEDARYANLVGKRARVPLTDRSVVVRTSAQVDPVFGTGLVMTCTWGDQEDVDKWRLDKLDTQAIVATNGILNELAGAYQGLNLLEARDRIIKDLKEASLLVKQESLTHTLNVHERCGIPTEFIRSKQWFIRIAELKETWKKYGNELQWYPSHAKQIYDTWVDSLKWDWCVSRQRYFGVPFPLWYCQKCEEPIFAREEDLPVNPLEDHPPTKHCPKCGSAGFIPESDVLDTWATSSCTPFLIRELVGDERVKKALFPATLRPNAHEIIRTWDFYSIVKSHYHFNSLPFRDMMISGHGLDEQGRKIAKRLGNYVPSDELVKQYGADAIRYWATGATLGQNLRFSPQEIEKGKKTVTKLWNAARFIVLNLAEYDPKQEQAVKYEFADAWVIQELNQTITIATEAFELYTYARAKNEADNFFWSKFADYYLEFVKYRLRGDERESKRAAQHTLYAVFQAILKLYAPIMPFIAEELYAYFYAERESVKSIHLSSWPTTLDIKDAPDASDFESAIAAIDEIRKYKTSQGLSLAVELAEYTIHTKLDVGKYGEFVKQAIRVKHLKSADYDEGGLTSSSSSSDTPHSALGA